MQTNISQLFGAGFMRTMAGVVGRRSKKQMLTSIAKEAMDGIESWRID